MTLGTVSFFKKLWFRDPAEDTLYINDTAVRIRAGLLLIIPLFMGLTLYDANFNSSWIVTGEYLEDTLETDWDERIIYRVEAVKRTYDYSVQTLVLLYALLDMLAGMFVVTARFSPSICLATFLANRHFTSPPVWKPLVPKRFAWTIGATFIVLCLLFFNPDVFAGWINRLTGRELLPETYNYMPFWIPNTLVWLCIGFMWMETVLGFCVGCQIHAFLVWLGLIEEPCEACNNIDWEAIARKKQEQEQL